MLGVGGGPQAKDAILNIEPSLTTGNIGVSLALRSLDLAVSCLTLFYSCHRGMSPVWLLRKQFLLILFTT